MGQGFISPGRLLSKKIKATLRGCLPAPERKIIMEYLKRVMNIMKNKWKLIWEELESKCGNFTIEGHPQVSLCHTLILGEKMEEIKKEHFPPLLQNKTGKN